MCVLAGPGTGKTTALIRRVARFLEDGHEPQRILVATFTRTAAKDLLRQLQALEHPGVPTIHAGTLHGMCFGLLGSEKVFPITKRVPRPLLDFEADVMLDDLTDSRFGSKRQKERRLKAFGAAWARLAHETPGWPTDEVDRAFSDSLHAWLRFHRSMLIDELVPVALSFLRNNPASSWRGFYKDVLIDEYQDLNGAEQALGDLLAEDASLFVVGDDDQSIYSFKHAHPEGIINFAEHHAETQSKTLDECGRCPRIIIDLANNLILHNTRPLPDRCVIPTPECPEGEAHIVQWKNSTDEARGLATFTKRHLDAREVPPGEVLVLSPRRRIGYRIRDEILKLGVPAQSHFSEQALDPAIARERFTLLTLLANHDDRVALRYWLAHPTPRPAAYRWLVERSQESGKSPWAILEAMCGGELETPKAVEPFKERFKTLDADLKKLRGLTGLPLIQAWLPNEEEGLDEIRKLALEVEDSSAEPMEPSALREQLREHITSPEAPIESDSVRIMSLHKSKGLGAKLVVIVGAVEGLIPFSDDELPDEDAREDLEEQRRLFYVAITRARQTLVISSARYFNLQDARNMNLLFKPSRTFVVESIASRFIEELGPNAPRAVLGEPWLEYVTSGRTAKTSH
jgi:DNA helicase II / ATP-dependent DNA helicase PcrA